MTRYPKPMTDLGPLGKAADEPQQPDPAIADVSIDRLLDNGLLVLYREMRNLTTLSARGKLDAASARDLRDTVKLLFELKDRELELLKGISDEELRARANIKQDSDPSGEGEKG